MQKFAHSIFSTFPMRVLFCFLYIFLGIVCGTGKALAQDTLELSRQDCEAIFLKENLLLIAEKLEVPKAEAVVQQARLWPNPNFTLDQVNLWATKGQTGGREAVPPLFGNFGRNQQFGFEVQQLIQTARKRSKLVAVEQVNADKASLSFDELLRNLKVELRKNLTNLQYLQLREEIYLKQLASVSQLMKAYQAQADQGFIPRSEVIRLKALELEITRNISEIARQNNEAQKELRLWLRLPPATRIRLNDAGFVRDIDSLRRYTIAEIEQQAKLSRPDLQTAMLEETRVRRLIDYEKARRVPDLTLKGTYDRNGNTMLNFFGFGVVMDLPLFDRNQGNIRQAQIQADQSRKLTEYKSSEVENEIALAYSNLLNALELASKIDRDYEAALDDMLLAHTRNFTNRNMSMLEFLDFLDAYLENKQIILEARKSVNDQVEELNYCVGRDLL